ncbi:MAG: hypothetical protein H6Q68_1714 [Firmicutes bacterium]|nr:hypothetical protein [Bacillota bacterium]
MIKFIYIRDEGGIKTILFAQTIGDYIGEDNFKVKILTMIINYVIMHTYRPVGMQRRCFYGEK